MLFLQRHNNLKIEPLRFAEKLNYPLPKRSVPKCKMDSDKQTAILKQLDSLEDAIRSLTDIVLSIAEPEKLSQIYTVSELAERWKSSESNVRRIIKSFGLNVVLGANKKPRKPLCVFKSEVVKYEQAQLKAKRKNISLAPKFGKTARGFNPFIEEPVSTRKSFGNGAHLGDL